MRGIIFDATSVRAILAGKKTMTRRAVSGAVYIAGSTLYVKEAWSPDHAAFYPHFPVIYKADGHDPRDFDLSPDGQPEGQVYSPEAQQFYPFRWRSPLFMPRSASRITIKVTEQFQEPLARITEADAIREGCSGVAEFRERWEKINGMRAGGRYAWARNPTVTVYGFEVIQKG